MKRFSVLVGVQQPKPQFSCCTRQRTVILNTIRVFGCCLGAERFQLWMQCLGGPSYGERHMISIEYERPHASLQTLAVRFNCWLQYENAFLRRKNEAARREMAMGEQERKKKQNNA